MMEQKQKKGLGKGLNALISSNALSYEEGEGSQENKSGIVELDIHKIEPNQNQPRKHFDQESLIELAESIKNYGIIQPLIVKQEENYYSIVAGERRWRAARIAKKTKIPVIIKDYNDAEIMQVALIENLQRQDLNPIEEAECYQRLAEEYFFSQEDIANKLGKKRAVVSYYMNLLHLDPRVKNFIVEGKLTAGHGRILLQLKNNEEQFHLSEQIIEDGLTVKETDFLVKKYVDMEEQNTHASEEAIQSMEKKQKEANAMHKSVFRKIEEDLHTILGTKVQIKNGKNKGKIEIEYYNEEELDRILTILKNNKTES